ncbi:MAG: PKD domain-containing protein [Bacteroidetes bacterium]|nr:PKD domain-containing protein [Bacteroidota bacterium]MBT6687504.1 PKD domain-containing protein [Bacteroidota bacterium]MBT7142992.1 PKD domain-containing protein [Bacteroidota bacterium]MBT7491682.1 PKD domain-containing protein [Bacteroidota bacterium]
MEKKIKITGIIILLLMTITQLQSQDLSQFDKAKKSLNEKGEVFFKFEINTRSELETVSKIISIDRNYRGTQKTLFAYANSKEFTEFLNLGYKYEVLTNPGDLLKNPKMLTENDFKGAKSWDSYPTYQAYVAMMYSFETNYPGLCKIYDIGETVQGRKILYAKISDSVNVEESEPRFNYTSSMHGDETVGYVLMLRLIDYLLSNYGIDSTATSLVNNIEIWINPNANPDGTYAAGNNTVSGATRYNANNVDLNRNFPDFDDGEHPDGNQWQTENIVMMDFADSLEFVMSANIHGGVEVVNYPWDTQSALHADDNWWERVARMYADTAQTYSQANYFTALNNGITNGYQWYPVAGGRQDFMQYYHYCREMTLELSNTKNPSGITLPTFWDANYRSLLTYIEEVLYGVNGIVTDSVTGEPLKAQVFVENHDIDNSFVYSKLPLGDYHRPIYEGTYDITYSSPGYFPKTFSLNIVNGSALTLDVQLVAAPPIVDFFAEQLNSCTGEIQFVDMTNTSTNSTYSWDFGDGNSSTEQNPFHNYYASGIYNVSLTVTNSVGSNTFTINNMINIDLLPEPSVVSASRCDIGTLTLSASGSGLLNWYDEQFGGNILSSGNTFTTPILLETTTYYVEDMVSPPTLSAAKADNTGGGGYFNNYGQHYLVFDCYEAVTLDSVKVYASGTYDRVIQLIDNTGSVLQSITVNIPDGESMIYLGFEIPIANDLQLAGPPFPNLYRNNAGLSYPYELQGIVSIKHSSASSDPTGYYYYFYDWKLSQPTCLSDRATITATVEFQPIADFDYTSNLLTVEFIDQSANGTTFYWDFGDGTFSSEVNPIHTYASSGAFQVQQIVSNTCGNDTSFAFIDLISTIDFSANGKNNVKIFPNPAFESFVVSFDNPTKSDIEIIITNIIGEIIDHRYFKNSDKTFSEEINIKNQAKGIYLLKVNFGVLNVTRKILHY